MATTTIFDVVKISELPVVQRTTDGDYLIINDNDPSTGVTQSKQIVISDLALGVVERSELNQIKDVVISSPKGGEVLRWDGSQWVNSPEDNSHIILSDLSARNVVTDPAAPGGKLEYEKSLGIFYFHPANINGPISQAGNVSATTDAPNDKDTLSWNVNTANWEPAPVVTLTSLNLPPTAGDPNGKVEISGYRIDYTPPHLGDYLLISDFVEEDPVFRRHPAFTIGGSDIDKWNEAWMWGDHAVEGYLKSLTMNGLSDVSASNPNNDDVVSYNQATGNWIARSPKLTSINNADDVVITAAQNNQILRYNTSAQEWKNVDNSLEDLVDVDVNLKIDNSILYYNATTTKWMPQYVQIIDDLVAGDALSGGGRPLDIGTTLRLDVVPGNAADVNGDKLNVRVGDGANISAGNDITVDDGPGLTHTVNNGGLQIDVGVANDTFNGKLNVRVGDGANVNTNNDITVDDGPGLTHTPSNGGLQIDSGIANDTTGGKLNVRVGNGLEVDLNNNIVIDAGAGLNHTVGNNGLEVNAGDAINLLNDKVNVVYDDISIKKNSNNELYVVFPTINTNAPVVTGSIIMWASLSIPSGYIECNGQSTASYPDLAAVVGPTVPDLRGEFVRGWDHSRGVDSGRNLVSTQDHQFQDHKHSYNYWNQGSFGGANAAQRADTSRSGLTTNNASSGNRGNETRPRNVALMYLIKT